MDFLNAILALRKLVRSPHYDLGTYSKAHAVIAGLYVKNRDGHGRIQDAALEEKIGDVEMYFQHLCGLEENITEEEVYKKNLIASLHELHIAISEESVDPHVHRQDCAAED